MDIKELKLSLLMLGWVITIDNKDSIFWSKGEQTLQWDRDQENPLFKQMIFHEEISQAHRHMLVRGSGSMAISHAYTTFEECLREVSND